MTDSATIPTIDPASVVRTRLSNGLTVLIRRDRSAPVVAIVTYVSAGYFDETDDIVGIAHVLEHMYFKGTPTRGVGEIAKQTKAVGGYLNAATIYDHTSYYTVLPSSGFAQGLDVQVDAYARSLIDGDELARELEVIIQEAKRKADNPGAVATETLYELLHDRHRIRRWRIGREPGLRLLTREALVGFYSKLLSSWKYSSLNPRRRASIPGSTRWPKSTASGCTASSRAAKPSRYPGPIRRGCFAFQGSLSRELSGDDRSKLEVAFGWRTPGTDALARCRVTGSLGGRARQWARIAVVPRGARAALGVVGVGVQLHANGNRRVRRSCRNSTRHPACRCGARHLGSVASAIRGAATHRRTRDRTCEANPDESAIRPHGSEGHGGARPITLAEWEAAGDDGEWAIGISNAC